MKYKVIYYLTLSLVLFSCKKEDNSPTPLDEVAIAKIDDSIAKVNNSKAIVEPNPVSEENLQKAANVVAAAPSTTVGINPEHGLPGHRCDIPVGAPLNSPAQPQPAAQPIPQQISPIQVPTAPTTPVAVAPGTNPAHGQPGHRCDLPVGASLN